MCKSSHGTSEPPPPPGFNQLSLIKRQESVIIGGGGGGVACKYLSMLWRHALSASIWRVSWNDLRGSSGGGGGRDSGSICSSWTPSASGKKNKVKLNIFLFSFLHFEMNSYTTSIQTKKILRRKRCYPWQPYSLRKFMRLYSTIQQTNEKKKFF